MAQNSNKPDKITRKETKKLRKEFTSQFFKGNKLPFAVSVFSVILIGAINLFLSWLLQQIIDTMGGVQGTYHLSTLAIITMGLVGGILIVAVLNYFFDPIFYRRAMKQYKNYAFKLLTKKSISSFTDETTATYLSALTNDANNIETKYLEKIFDLIQSFIFFFGGFALMLYYSPLLTLIAVILTSLPIVASIMTGNKLGEEEKRVSDRNESFTATLKDCLNGFSIIKSFKAEMAVLKMFTKYNDDAENAKYKRRRRAAIVKGISMLASIIAQLGVFLAGAYLALSGSEVTPGVVMVFLNLMGLVILPIKDVPLILADRNASYALIDKLAKALNTHIREEGTEISGELKKGISIHNLCFQFEENKNVLNGITTTFEAGKSYAIVGASGSGKSTLLNLLMASHSNYSGEIRYDDIELGSIHSKSLYDMVSIIQQNVFIFNASIRDNITMFREFPKEEVDHAIHLSGLSELIESKGEDYLCGENGNGLSGGERQRISIARSLLRKTPVLLVDEATAALDKETANHVSNSILGLEDYIRIVVTHALEESQLKQYDQILTLKNGLLLESGDFQSLLDKKGYFYSLYTVSQ